MYGLPGSKMYQFYSFFVIFLVSQQAKCAPTDNLDDILNNVGKATVFQLDEPATPFIGRVTELSTIKWVHMDKKFVVITGIRGIGKSELARKYASEYKEDGTANILWVNTTSITQMVADFKNLHTKLIDSVENKQITVVVKNVFNHFKSKKALWVFDGAEKDNILLKHLKAYIGNSPDNSVIVTSRDEDWDANLYNNVKLTPFPKADGIKYVKIALKNLDIPTDETNCEKLADALEYLPLALKKCSDIIIQRNEGGHTYTIDDFIRQLNGNELPTTTIIVITSEDEEIEKDLIDKITIESAKIGDKIATGATQAWEKVSGGASYVGSQVSYGAQQAGKEITSAAKHVGSEVKKFFSGFG